METVTTTTAAEFEARVPKGIILRGLVGSTVHGLGVPGHDDRDEIAVVMDPIGKIVGFGESKNRQIRTQKQGERSGPGDIDLAVYGLRNFCRLALQGNPSIILPFFTPESTLVSSTQAGLELRQLHPLFVSQEAGARFAGYLKAQKERLMGIRGQKDTRRSELAKLHGYDTKYAMHVVRLAFQGEELMRTGRITLPMPEEQREITMRVRRGEMFYTDVLKLIEEREEALLEAWKTSDLPEKPDASLVEQWMIRTYLEHWFPRA